MNRIRCGVHPISHRENRIQVVIPGFIGFPVGGSLFKNGTYCRFVQFAGGKDIGEMFGDRRSFATLSFRPMRTCHFDRREKSWYHSPSRFLPLVGMTMPHRPRQRAAPLRSHQRTCHFDRRELVIPTDATLSFRPKQTCHSDRNEPVISTEANLSFRPKGEILLEGIWLLANIKISPLGRNDRDGCPGCLTTPCEKERAPGRNARRQFMASPCRVTLRSCPRRGNPTCMTWIG